ncbi:MAG: CoA-transferase [Gammaproteobacteria bacterium]|jgi:propionate CoA-transferase
MRVSERIGLVGRILWWRLNWERRDLDYRPPETHDRRFMSAREAAGLVPDGACCLSSGMAGNARCSTLLWAIRERFEREGHPRALTWIAVGGQGGRGRAPGSVEEVGLPGLLERFISGHVETTKAMLAMADAGQLELHVLPQGEMCFALEAQGQGGDAVESRTGVGTVLDPRCGRGSPVTPGARLQLIEPAGEMLRYRLPRLDVAVLAAPWADAEGNVYFHDAATITEMREAARAARANGGCVLVSVAGIVPVDPARISLAAEMVDAIAVNPRQEQTILSPQRGFLPLFTPSGDGDDAAAIEKLRFINRFLKLTPVRGPIECALARLGAHIFARAVAPPAGVNIGVGFGEEVCRELYQSPLRPDLTFTTETGVYGGLPAPGIYFGAAVHPERLESSAWVFHHYRDHLDATVLGFLEVDAAGNVNVSRRGPRFMDYVGPGGLPSITASARTCLFVGTFMQGAEWAIEDGRMVLKKAGKPKLVDAVSEVTFSGREALKAGKQVWYVTTVGAFRLTESGLVLEVVMPGLDVERDIRPNCGLRFTVPEDGPAEAPASVLTGREYRLAWGLGGGAQGGSR